MDFSKSTSFLIIIKQINRLDLSSKFKQRVWGFVLAQVIEILFDLAFLVFSEF